MKKLRLIGSVAALALTIGHGAQAQEKNIMEEGTITVNVGIGVGRSTTGDNLYNNYGYGYGSAFGIKAAVERGMWQLGPGVLTLGLELGGSFSSGSLKSNIVIVAARSAYHFGWDVPNLDTYAGFAMGPGFRSYDHYSSASTINSKNDVIFAPGIFAGGSYFFSPNIGVNVEVGYDITVIQGGVVFKLN